ncbi:acyl-CoA carboxylase subunit beta [Halieaceae bacterium IMCC14734]|uniref:Acyl-CoA carboxylase subunit beta n=1 Tax=Candidatus Litorirhabdus singularis TaxID=2518993 RepID=A0ABT3TFM0_9GAMM|nr:carboxyl transferase domain-containing protein [Candidatus Litorirhabdus singularis]MCX2981115.1 acyl-CoA carboxylase subunit beta [Candidatus Litorirhabdus singularis]
MAILESAVDSRAAVYAANVDAMKLALDEFRGIEQRVLERAQGKAPTYAKRGFMSPRERLSQLLDAGAPFLELSSLCGYMQDQDKDGSFAGGSVIAGIGYIEGTRCVIMIDDFLTKGGIITRLGGDKRMRMQNISMREKLPLVTLAQSGGGNLTTAGETFGPSGEIFANQCRLSAAGIPQITVVHGSATAGGAYQPGLSDYIVMIRRQSTVYLAGPPLLKAATGEIATDEEIGGAEMHAEIAGTADYLAENDADGIRIARDIVRKLGWGAAPQPDHYAEPLCARDELLGVVPADPKTPYDVREIIARVADGSDFLDFKPEYDAGTVCGHIEIKGQPCGVIGNNGPITANGAAKAGQFIQLCEQSATPLLFLHNTTGFIVGTESERAGIIKHGSKLIQAVTNSKTPKISVVVGGSYGAGNYAMCGRGMGPRFMFAWPRSVVSVMGPPQAGQVMRQVWQAQMQKAGDVDESELDGRERMVVEAMEAQSHALANTARVWDDALIDPRDTRDIVAFVLSVCREADQREVQPNTFGIARL